MTKAEITRLLDLNKKESLANLNSREMIRLKQLRDKLNRQQAEELPCPFRTDRAHPTCTKPGGVCSIRLYSEQGTKVVPLTGERGRLRALCPWRFHQDGEVFKRVGEKLLGDNNPVLAGEIGFLKSTGNLDSSPDEDVGRIDMILVKSSGTNDTQMEWVAAEVQAVYFSGKNMGIEFEYLKSTQGRLSMAVEKRRPDYRSSGVKRLMPQLLTKVPTLRRWGKKMAVIVDAPFFYSMGSMTAEEDVSNADIVWFVVDFVEDSENGPYRIELLKEFYTTLENATLGLTGGIPLSKLDFERRIKTKLTK